jgi:hypothetical protein
VDYLGGIKSIRQQLADALAAYPHDYEEACLRLLAADAALAVLERDGERELANLNACADDEEAASSDFAGRADQ